MKETLLRLWSSLNNPVEEKINTLIDMFDSLGVSTTPSGSGSSSLTNTTTNMNNILLSEFVKKYQQVEKKLTARLPISKVNNVIINILLFITMI